MHVRSFDRMVATFHKSMDMPACSRYHTVLHTCSATQCHSIPGGVIVQSNCKTIFRVKSTKFLGVIIDDKLKWTAHIQYIKNKLSKSIGIMYKCRNYFDKETM